MTTTIIASGTAPKVSNHVGQIGDTVRIDGVIKMMFEGRDVLHVIEDLDGNQFTVRRRKCLGSSKGVLVTIEAVVLRHEEYKGIKRTVLSTGTDYRVMNDHAFVVAGKAR